MLLAIHFARSGLLGHSPIPCPSQKFLLRLRVLQTLSRPLPSVLCMSRAGLVRNAKRKESGSKVSLPLNLSFPHFYRMCSTEHPKRSPEPAFRLCRMCASKIFQSVPKNAILIRLQDKKKSLAKISDLWHNGSRTISDLQECRTHTIRKVMKMESSHTDAPYLFQISSYDISRLLPQVSKALEKRSEYPLSQNVAIY